MYYRFVSPFAWIITFFLVLFVYTRFFGPISFSINSVTTAKSKTFDVSGEGKQTVKPDLALLSVGVRSQGATVKEAQDQINISINKVTEAEKGLGIDSKDIQTANYNINPDYDYSSQPQKIKGYSASTSLSIKVRDVSKVNSAIDVATASGANEVFGINFDVSDKTKAENEARQKAVTDAKTRAAAASKIAGFRLGKIINYTENLGNNYPRPIPLVGGGVGATTDVKQIQVEPGSQDITITVTLSYEIQ